jgi:hypothetical protein
MGSDRGTVEDGRVLVRVRCCGLCSTFCVQPLLKACRYFVFLHAIYVLTIGLLCLMHQVDTLRKSLANSKANARLVKALADLDEDDDGNINVAELMQYVERAAKHEDMVQQLKWVAGAGFVLVLLMSLAVFGVSWGVVALTKELSSMVRHQTLQT